MIVLLLAALAAAGPAVVERGVGAPLHRATSPAPSGSAAVWLRCTWTTAPSDGPETRATCAGEGELAWTFAEGAFTWELARFVPDAGCTDAAALAGATWRGRVGPQRVIAQVALEPRPTPPPQVAGDLLAELGDALQRLVVPLPEEPLRDGTSWALRIREEGAGLAVDVIDRWTASRADDGGVALAWREEASLAPIGDAATTTRPTVERWSGALRLGEGLLAVGRWKSERPLRVEHDGRSVVSTAACSGELR